MRVLVLGGTGSIGRAVVDVLVQRGHSVSVLARSVSSESHLLKAGASPVYGDIREPLLWIDTLEQVDAIVHAASTWSDDMDAVDRRLMSVLLEKMQSPVSCKALIYTGGCWLYGQTGDTVATEASPWHSVPSFQWSIDIINQVLAETSIRGMAIHPAMMYEHRGGVFGYMYDDLKKFGIRQGVWQ